jgi:ribosomal-protein-serine acetyltransferase
MELDFDTFKLRPFRVGDHRSFFDLIENNRERLSKYFPATVRSTTTPAATQQYITEKIMLAEKLEFISFVIVSSEHRGILGLIFLKNIDWSIPKSEMGFFIDRGFEGKGIISRGVWVVTNYALKNLKINKLYMRVGEDNPGSRRVAEKCGFALEGKLKNDFKSYDGSLLDVYYYGITPQDLNSSENT